MIFYFPMSTRRLLGVAFLLLPLLGYGQRRTMVVGAASKEAMATPEFGTTAVLTGRISSPTTDSVAVSFRENPLGPARERVGYPSAKKAISSWCP